MLNSLHTVNQPPTPVTKISIRNNTMVADVSGLILVDKAAGWTSHDVVSRTRKIAGTRKVGHAGTLDPMATGLLVIGFNKATRLLTYIVDTTKTYRATMRFGQDRKSTRLNSSHVATS